MSRAGNTNLVTAELFGKSRSAVRADDAIISVCRAIFPLKAAHHVAELTGYSVRNVEYWFAGAKMPADALAALIRSDYGVRFVAALMADANPPWWSRLKSYLTALDAMRLHRAAKRKLQEAIDAEGDLSAAIEESARVLSGEDCNQRRSDAGRQVGWAKDRALARK